MNDFLGLAGHLINGISIGFFASIPLGPIGVMCIQRTLNKGRRSGFVSGLGAASSDFVYAVIAGFSVEYIMNFVEEQKQVLSIIGAIVFFLLGLRLFLSNPVKEMRRRQQREILLAQVEEQVPQISRKHSSGLVSDFFSTFFLTITNPVALFLFLGLFSIVNGERTLFTQIFLLVGVFCGAAAWWLILTLLVGTLRKKITLRRLYYINKVAGGIIIFLVMSALAYEFGQMIYNWIVKLIAA